MKEMIPMEPLTAFKHSFNCGGPLEWLSRLWNRWLARKQENWLSPEEEAAIVEDINSGRWPYLAPRPASSVDSGAEGVEPVAWQYKDTRGRWHTCRNIVEVRSMRDINATMRPLFPAPPNYTGRAEATEARLRQVEEALRVALEAMNHAYMTIPVPDRSDARRAWSSLVDARNTASAALSSLAPAEPQPRPVTEALISEWERIRTEKRGPIFHYSEWLRDLAGKSAAALRSNT